MPATSCCCRTASARAAWARNASVADRSVDASHVRRSDAIAAAAWLTRQPGTPPGGVDLVGWSNGGSTVLYTAAQQPDLPSGLFRRFVAFYPGCATESRTPRGNPPAR